MRRSLNRTACGRRIGICGYTVVPEDRRTCLFSVTLLNGRVCVNDFAMKQLENMSTETVWYHWIGEGLQLWTVDPVVSLCR